MPVSLAEFEHKSSFAGDYRAELEALQARLARLQLAQIVHGRHAIILFEGWEGAGKRAALKRLAAAWDPCFVTTWSRRAEDQDRGRHWLAPFWAALPESGETAIFFRSWYRRIIDARALGRLDDDDWTRAHDEINEFEAQQTDNGAILIKLFFHVSSKVQHQRLRERGEHPWRRWTVQPEDLQSHQARDGYLSAWTEMFSLSDTRWAPWTIVDGDDKRASRIAALSAVADRLEAALPSEPPVDDEKLVMLAREKYG